MKTSINSLRSLLLGFLLMFVILKSLANGLESAKNGYGTKTPYFLLHLPDEKVKEDDLYNVNTDKLTCEAVHVSAVIRHGARNPEKDSIIKISDIHKRIKDNLDKVKFKTLSEWSNYFSINNEFQLNDGGRLEQKILSQRISQRLKSLFLTTDLSSVKFIVSTKKRTEGSAMAFYDGMKEQLQISEENAGVFASKINNQYMRYYTSCPEFEYTVADNKTAYKEYSIFQSSEALTGLSEKINKILGLEDNLVKTDELETIFNLCGIEKALFNTSPWCNIFDKDDLAIMEYNTDLKKYYIYGPVHKITSKMSCPLVSELFKEMDDMKLKESNHEGHSMATLMFGHINTLLPLYAALGLFNDSVPLMSDNFNKHEKRLFRISNIVPFSANIIFILYKCKENEQNANGESDEDYLIQVLVNEKPILMPGCKDILCSYSELRERYVELIENCHFDDTCKKTVNNGSIQLLTINNVFIIIILMMSI